MDSSPSLGGSATAGNLPGGEGAEQQHQRADTDRREGRDRDRAAAGAEHVELSEPASYFLENFIGAPVGTAPSPKIPMLLTPIRVAAPVALSTR